MSTPSIPPLFMPTLESLLVFPTLGIQLETHRGHPLLPALSTSHHFIPLSALEDVIIHEGFQRWDVRYYMAALKRTRGPLPSAAADATHATDAGSGIEICVAFEVCPRSFPLVFTVMIDPTHVRRTFSLTFRSSKRSILASKRRYSHHPPGSWR